MAFFSFCRAKKSGREELPGLNICNVIFQYISFVATISAEVPQILRMRISPVCTGRVAVWERISRRQSNILLFSMA
jgi:hypothetical protein